MTPQSIILYGSYGYTGKLIAEVCKERKLSVILAGRNRNALERQSEETGYGFEVVEIIDTVALTNLLRKGRLVIHCAGPFQRTAKPMAEACINAGVHYTDISGEFNVFETLSTFDNTARTSGIMIMPGTGFDVVPSDCLALHLKKRLPGATHLQLAFTMSKGGLSRGTAKTSIEGLGYGSTIRKDGRLVPIPAGRMLNAVDFGPFTAGCHEYTLGRYCYSVAEHGYSQHSGLYRDKRGDRSTGKTQQLYWVAIATTLV